jgi:hypothetical protein
MIPRFGNVSNADECLLVGLPTVTSMVAASWAFLEGSDSPEIISLLLAGKTDLLPTEAAAFEKLGKSLNGKRREPE